MKNLYLLVTVFLIVGSVYSQKATIKFKHEKHDFGTIKEVDGKKDYKFEFTNTGKAPLMILKVKPSCGCTSTDYTKQPILPGKDGYIIASYDPKGRPGKFNKSIAVTTNADVPTKKISFSGTVIPKKKGIAEMYPVSFNGLRFKSKDFMLMKVKNTEVKTDTFGFVNTGEQLAKLSFSNIPSFVKIQFFPESVKPKQKGYVKVSYDGSKVGKWGYVRDQIYLMINGEKVKNNMFTITTTISEDFTKLSPSEIVNAPKLKLDKKKVDFGEVSAGDLLKCNFELTNEGKSDLVVRKLKANYSFVKTTLDKTTIKPNETVILKVEFDTKGKRGRQSCNIKLITNDPKRSSNLLFVRARVRN